MAVEALAAGRPVVATRVVGIPELVEAGESGLLVEAGDPTALAEAIARVLGDPALAARLAAAGRARSERMFDLQEKVRAEMMRPPVATSRPRASGPTRQ